MKLKKIILTPLFLTTVATLQLHAEAELNLKERKKSILKYANEKNYKKVIELAGPYADSLSLVYLSKLAKAYRAKEQTTNEISLLKNMIAKDDSKYHYHYWLGKALLKDKQQAKGVKALRKSIKLKPSFETAYTILLNHFKTKKNNYESRIIVQDMMKQFGAKAKFYTELCSLYTTDSFLKEAIEFCQKAIQKNSKEVSNYIHLGLSYYDKKEITKAIKTLVTASKKFPNDELIQWTVGDLHLKEKNYPVALRYFTKAVQSDSKSSRSQLGLALSAYQLKKYNVALIAFEKACSLDVSSIKHFRSAEAKLRLDGQRSWSQKYNSKMYSCRR